MIYTPEEITELKPNEYIVVGTSYAGAHGGGAARYAYEHFGLVWGCGSGIHKADGRDQFNLIPLFIECKDQKNINVKSDWRIASAKASVGQAPVVVFPDQDKKLCVMRFEDLLQLQRESMDWREAAENLRRIATKVSIEPFKLSVESDVRPTVTLSHTCPNGHIVDDYGYCQSKGCRYVRGYKAPKVKK